MRNLLCKIGFCLCLLIFVSCPLHAQDKCGTDHIHRQWLESDPAYQQKVEANEIRLQKAIAKIDRTKSTGNDTIPVVVHVLHTGQTEGSGMNISDAQIISAIDNLNDAFSGNLGSTGTDIGIRFAFAKRSPSGCISTNGINRVDATGVQDYENVGIATDATRSSLFDLSRWNPIEYLNIWIVHEINDGTSTRGFATLPPASYDYDGIVMLYQATGYDPDGSLGYNLPATSNKNKSLVHEVGHYLSLYHTFQGDNDRTTCPTDADCGTNGDCCADTDPHQRTYSNVCWTNENNSCTGTNYGDVVTNYMAYSSQDCRDMFTSDQIDRMTSALTTLRSDLLSGYGYEESASINLTPASCSPNILNMNNSFALGISKVTINGHIFSSGGTIDDDGNADFTCRQINLEAGTTYTVNVENNGPNQEHIFIYLDYNNDGDFDTPTEGPIYSSPSTSHSIDLTTPANPLYNTSMRMRIISDFVANTGYEQGCQDLDYGQAEDYSVYFESPAELTASTDTLNNFQAIAPDASSTLSFTLSGEDLFGDAKLELSGSDYEISSNGSDFFNMLTITETAGNLQGEPVTIYARLKSGLSGGMYTDDITISSTDADSLFVHLSGNVIETDGERGNAFSVSSGSASNYAIADEYVGITGSNPRTYEAWIKTTDNTTNDAAIIANGVNVAGQKWIIRLDDGRLRTEINGDYVVGDQLINDNNWHHIAVVLNGTTLDDLILYTDGKANGVYASGSSTMAVNTAGSQRLWIGMSHANDYWEGDIDELRVWSTARTQAEIRANMHLTLTGGETGLEAYYQFNETSGNAVKDQINDHDLTLNGAVSLASSTVDVAKGVCETVNVGATGSASVEVDNNNLQIDFADGSTAPDGDLMIYRLESCPANSPGDAYEGTEHWVVRNFGNNESGLDIEAIQMSLANSDPILNYHKSTMRLYKRASGSDGSWDMMASSANSTDPDLGTVSFTNLTGFNSFSQLMLGSTAAVLPVEFRYFTARRLNAQKVRLEWITESESNNRGFELQTSYDGKEFKVLDFIPGQGTVNSPTTYQLDLPERKPVYYRLNQIDIDGKETLSEIRFVEGIEDENLFTVLPNPTKGDIQIFRNDYLQEELIRCSLVNINGRIILNRKGDVSQINELLNQELNRQPDGIYILQFNIGYKTYTHRLVVNRD